MNPRNALNGGWFTDRNPPRLVDISVLFCLLFSTSVIEGVSPVKTTKWLFISLICLSILIPVSAFAFYKPIRVMMPEFFGINCQSSSLCVEDESQLARAAALVEDSKRHLSQNWGLSVGEPRFVFCSSEQCKQTFGLSKAAGLNVGTLGIVITPRGWSDHYVAHELIHYWQADNFGSLSLIFSESWVTEGMAYALSNDPRKELHEPFESYRKQFQEWHKLHLGVPLKEAIKEVI